ncbi:methyl-accepting chemotaxis protein [Pantoea agglomerans]|uniref:methyl-accepting chemotaxis protein n=1 Tax=Pantoea TaxID=53335 RepID=UPI00068BB309|nr:methyl-accepting chemotaxis protein [Pantoea sp. CFSAN033090]KOA71291.1 resolvase [Pantoea sp. CFSAN033090]
MYRNKRIKLSVMFTTAFVAVILTGVFVTAFAGFKLNTASDQQELTSARLADLQALQSIKDNLTQQTVLLLSVPSGPQTQAEATLKTQFFALQATSDDTTAYFRGLINDAKSIPGINLAEVEEASTHLKKIEVASGPLNRASQHLFVPSAIPLQDKLRGEVLPVLSQYREAVNEMVDYQARVTRKTAQTLSQALSGVYMTLAAMTTLFVIMGFVISGLITRWIKVQLGGEPFHAQDLATAIAAGDLTTTVKLRRGDAASLMASLSVMQNNLRDLVSKIKDSSTSVALAADEISQGNIELSSRTEQQAAALQETAASMEQLTATVKSNSEGAQQTAGSARETAHLVRSGEADVQRMSDTMSAISVSAAKVNDITSIIESIAFQTNILALNAAVEAARAGEQGRGFAVVAGEVRTLAQRSASAAYDIKQLMAEAVSVVDNGVVAAAAAGKSILKIVGRVGELAETMDNISLASSEQMQGISQVSVAISQIDGVTQNNAALVEESSSASHSLSEQVHALRGIVESFRV